MIFSNEITSEEIDAIKKYKDTNYKSKEYFNIFASIVDKEFEIKDASLCILLYEACVFNDELSLANKYLNMAISIDKKNDMYRDLSFKLEEYRELLSRAKKTYEKDLFDESIRDYLNIIKLYPNRALPYYEQGIVYRSMKNYDDAIASFNKALNLNPNKELYEKAIISIAQRIGQEADQDAKRQDYNSAIPKYLQAIEYYPAFTQALFNLAKAFYFLTDYENSKKYLLLNIEVDETQYQSLKMLGDIYRKERNIGDASIYYKKAIETNPAYYKAYYSLATLYINTNPTESKIYLEKVIDIKPDYSKGYETLGILNIQLGENDEAIGNLFLASELDSRNYKCNYLLADIYNQKAFIDSSKENFALAKEYAKKALSIKRNCAPAYFHLGIAEKGLGNKPAAKDAFEKAKSNKDWRASAAYELELLEKGK